MSSIAHFHCHFHFHRSFSCGGNYQRFLVQPSSPAMSGRRWISKGFDIHLPIVYKKTDERYIEWQRVATNDNEWYNEWQRVVQPVATSDNELQQMTMSDSKWQKGVQRVKTTHLLQKMDDCNSFYNENRYTTSRDGWLILEWLKRLPLTSSKKVAGLNK